MKIWQEILVKLEAGQRLYLLTVIDHAGSTPGRTGFKMMVADDGYISGSIGGGVMEFRLVEEAKKLLAGNEVPVFFKKQIHDKDEQEASGMICSGEQTVSFVPLDPSHTATLRQIVLALENNESCGIELSEQGLRFIEFTFLSDLSAKFKIEISRQELWSYRERLDYKDSIFIVGGGHVSVAVSDLFVSLGFYVTVFDNRENLNTIETNSSAHEKEIIDFNEVAKCIPEGDDIYVTIMTNKFTDDRLVLSKLVGKDLKYLGVLGSKAKLKKLWDWLLTNGFSETELARVSGPIGLQINSQTPLEIAVSIAAEIIGLRNGGEIERKA